MGRRALTCPSSRSPSVDLILPYERKPMSLIQAVLLAAVQGVSELFPVSSLAHAVILPRLLGWPIDQKAPEFLPFLVVLHLGTAPALLLYFLPHLIRLSPGLPGSRAPPSQPPPPPPLPTHS